jgi:hypothetical protein
MRYNWFNPCSRLIIDAIDAGYLELGVDVVASGHFKFNFELGLLCDLCNPSQQ